MERVIFIHIPKAAGRTIHSIVARQYRPDEVVTVEGRLGHTPPLPLDEAARARIVLGLVHYGIHQQLPGVSTYATLLRDPIDRVISLYRYILSNSKHHLHDKAAEAGLLGFIEGDLDLEEVENGQTRQIAGVTDGSPDELSLVQAKQYLKDTFRVVGLVERFDESLILLKRHLGWRRPFYVRMNVTGSFRDLLVSEEVVGAIRQKNLLDIELYEFARQLFEESIRQQGRSFTGEVALFRALNRAAGAYWSARNFARGRMTAS